MLPRCRCGLHARAERHAGDAAIQDAICKGCRCPVAFDAVHAEQVAGTNRCFMKQALKSGLVGQGVPSTPWHAHWHRAEPA